MALVAKPRGRSLLIMALLRASVGLSRSRGKRGRAQLLLPVRDCEDGQRPGLFSTVYPSLSLSFWLQGMLRS